MRAWVVAAVATSKAPQAATKRTGFIGEIRLEWARKGLAALGGATENKVLAPSGALQLDGFAHEPATEAGLHGQALG